MKYLMIISYLCCTCLASVAQTCVQDLVFSTQSEVDAFPIDYPTCTTIDGSVTLLGTSTAADIQDLSPLSQISLITGDLEIKLCNQLQSIQGLNENLMIAGNTTISDNSNLLDVQLYMTTSATSSIEISRNKKLESIIGENQIDSLYNLTIMENEKLAFVDGFEGLDILKGEILLLENDEIVNIPAFNTPSYIHSIRIDKCPKLEKIVGFNQLDSISNLFIVGVASLNTIIGFNKATVGGGLNIIGSGIEKIDIFQNLEAAGSIGLTGITQQGPIEIYNNLTSLSGSISLSFINGGPFNSLLNLEESGFHMIAILFCNFENLNFFSNMKRISGFNPRIRINNCPNLTDISGLDGMDPTTLKYFNIYNNSLLSICHSDLVCAVLERGDNDPPSVWENNGPGCNSSEEILEQCADKPDEPEDPTLCPIASRPGMQIDRVDDVTFNVMYHYGQKRMYLRDIAYTELIDLIAFHKVEKEIHFDFGTFTLERYCERAEVISRGESYQPNFPSDPSMEYKVNQTMSEIDFFRNFVLTIGKDESIKL